MIRAVVIREEELEIHHLGITPPPRLFLQRACNAGEFLEHSAEVNKVSNLAVGVLLRHHCDLLLRGPHGAEQQAVYHSRHLGPVRGNLASPRYVNCSISTGKPICMKNLANDCDKCSL